MPVPFQRTQVESALLEHSGVAEAAVVGYPHEIKGEGDFCGGHGPGSAAHALRSSAFHLESGAGRWLGVFAYVVMKASHPTSAQAQTIAELKATVRKHIGAFAAPDLIHVSDKGRRGLCPRLELSEREWARGAAWHESS
jgi:acetyl-CoA synthetase